MRGERWEVLALFDGWRGKRQQVVSALEGERLSALIHTRQACAYCPASQAYVSRRTVLDSLWRSLYPHRVCYGRGKNTHGKQNADIQYPMEKPPGNLRRRGAMQNQRRQEFQ